MDDNRDVTAKLVDVSPPSADWPDGYELNIADTILRPRYREGWDREVFMEPGVPYQISIGATTEPTQHFMSTSIQPGCFVQSARN